MADFVGRVTEFQDGEPIATPQAHADYLDNVIEMLERWALMARQDAEISATWLARRKPLKGRRVPWAKRVSLSRRTRGHGRQVGDALMEAVSQMKKWRDVNQDLEEAHGKYEKERESTDGQVGKGQHQSGG
ncbi:hypothetical protein ACFOY2_05565 [Nonomuraea purpurea]|uniref:Uncharacterized protein n=1 Tax=Nonomuraea purpurea TaxID=1849276 RepID=A0ABV8FYA0_9ACTN